MKEKEFKYVKSTFETLSDVFKQPILLLPFVYSAILAIIYAFVSTNITNKLVSPIPNPGLAISAILVFILYLALQILVGATALSSCRLYIDNKKITSAKQFQGGLELYWKYLGLSLFKTLLIIVPIIILTLIGIVIIFLASKNTGIYSPQAGIPLLILIFLLIILIFILALIFVFADVILTEKKNVFYAMKESYNIFRHHFSHSLKTILSIILFMTIYLGILFGIIILIFGLDAITNKNQTGVGLPGIIMNIFAIPASATALLYIFKARKKSLTFKKKK